MKKQIATLIPLLAILSSSFAQTGQATYKNKSGNPVGYSKSAGNKTTYYDKSHNKTGSSSTKGNTTTFYNKQGNKTLTSKTK
jgi:YD repeat-containing protein